MKKITKNLLFIMLMSILCMIMAVTANAETYIGNCGIDGDNVTWSLDTDSGVLTISGQGEMADYSYQTNSIPWKEYIDTIKSVVIESGVTVLGDYAFSYYGGYTSISISDSVTSIGSTGFTRSYDLKNIIVDKNNKNYSSDEYGVLFDKNKTELIQYPIGNAREEYIIPDTVIYISDQSFRFCECLVNISIPNSVTVIGNGAFQNCKNLKSVTIPKSVTTILAQPFMHCDSLMSIVVDKENEAFINDEYGVLFNKDKTELIQFPYAKACEEYIIPDSVTEIASRAFSDCSKIQSIKLPEGITEVDCFMFENCTELTSVTLPNSIISIGRQAFNNCEKLSNINIPNGVTSIEDIAFARCEKLTQIAIPDTVTSLGNSAFYCCDNLITITLPKNLNCVGDYLFYNCRKLTNIIIPDGTTSIGEFAFEHCSSLETITIPNSVTSIKNKAFNSCWKISDVYYDGYEEQWLQIDIGEMNENLTDANIHFKHRHNYDAVVTVPTCTAQGYTTYTCACGDSYIDDYTNKLAHEYTSEITTPATHLTEGIETFTCACGDSYTEVIEKIAKHNYKAVVTEPTCTANGYTTYTCECGDIYVADYTEAKGHSYSAMTTQPTCTQNGLVTTFCSSCGDTHTETLEPTGHSFTEGSSKCENCDFDKADDCSCNCHKSGFMGFIWKIILFFNKLFKTNKTCACGIAHY